MKNIETHGALRWGPVERKLQISYSPPPPKFAVVAEDSPVSLGSHAPGSEMGVASSRHPICTPKKSANSTSKNFIAVHKRNVRFCAGAISDGRPYRDSDPLVSQINWEWQTWVHFPIRHAGFTAPILRRAPRTRGDTLKSRKRRSNFPVLDLQRSVGSGRPLCGPDARLPSYRAMAASRSLTRRA